MVRVERFELPFHAPKARVITWLYDTQNVLVDRAGLEPASPACKAGGFPVFPTTLYTGGATGT